MLCLSFRGNAAELPVIGRERRQNRMCLRLQGLGQDRIVLHLQIDSILCPAQVWCHLLYSQRARFCHSKLEIESENFSIIELVWSLEKGYLLLLSINTHKENETHKSWLKTVLTTLSPHHCMVDPMKTRERIIYQGQNTGDLISSLTNINLLKGHPEL